jgi:CheY-like chemotaxis protein
MTKILIVDEAEILLKMERSLLRRAGFDLLLACNPSDLLEKARLLRPDIVLLHSRGHGGECGIPCARRLKEEPETSRIPVILVRAREEAMALPPPPCERVFDSPVEPQALIEAVSSLAGVRHRILHRVPASLPVEIRCGEAGWRGRTKDISAAGLFVVTGRPLQTGESVQVEVTLPTPVGASVVSARGIVVRDVLDDPSSYLIPGNGVRLVDIDEGGRRALEGFVGQQGTAS